MFNVKSSVNVSKNEELFNNDNTKKLGSYSKTKKKPSSIKAIIEEK